MNSNIMPSLATVLVWAKGKTPKEIYDQCTDIDLLLYLVRILDTEYNYYQLKRKIVLEELIDQEVSDELKPYLQYVTTSTDKNNLFEEYKELYWKKIKHTRTESLIYDMFRVNRGFDDIEGNNHIELVKSLYPYKKLVNLFMSDKNSV